MGTHKMGLEKGRNLPSQGSTMPQKELGQKKQGRGWGHSHILCNCLQGSSQNTGPMGE